jgi:hypothetical protein
MVMITGIHELSHIAMSKDNIKCQENLLTEAGLRAQSVVEILRLSSRSRMQNDLRSLGVENALSEFVRTSLRR